MLHFELLFSLRHKFSPLSFKTRFHINSFKGSSTNFTIILCSAQLNFIFQEWSFIYMKLMQLYEHQNANAFWDCFFTTSNSNFLNKAWRDFFSIKCNLTCTGLNCFIECTYANFMENSFSGLSVWKSGCYVMFINTGTRSFVRKAVKTLRTTLLIIEITFYTDFMFVSNEGKWANKFCQQKAASALCVASYFHNLMM